MYRFFEEFLTSVMPRTYRLNLGLGSSLQIRYILNKQYDKPHSFQQWIGDRLASLLDKSMIYTRLHEQAHPLSCPDLS